MKITYLAAVSADGFIARQDGDVSWLDDLNIDMSQTGIDEFMRSVDGLVMGRKTYDFIFEYGTWPYENKPTWVCTHRDLRPLAGANLIVTRDIDQVIADARLRGLTHLWLVGGGGLASEFLARELLTHMSISQMPVELGAGIPLFASHHWLDVPALNWRILDKQGYKQHEVSIRSRATEQ